MTTDRSDLHANLVDDLAAEVLARDPAYLDGFPPRIGDRAALAAHLAPAGLAAPDILDAVEEGVAVLAGRGVPVLRDGFDPVGETLVAGLIDAVLAGRGQLDLRPEPREARPTPALLAEEFEERRVAGRRVFVSRRTGETPLLVVGALGVPADLWQPLLADQDAPFRPILVELSAGSLTEGGLSSSDGLEAHAAALAEVLRGLDLGPVVALGWCNGGRIVLDLARRCDLVAGIVLLSPTLRGGGPAEDCGTAAPSPYEENFETAYCRVRTNPAFAGPLSRMLNQLFAAVDWGAVPDPAKRARTFLGRPRTAQAGAVGLPTATAAGLLHQAARTAQDEAYPLRDALLASRSVPILAVLGDCDGVVSNAETLERLSIRDDLVAVEIAGAGHYIGDLQYRYLRLALARFLAAPRAPVAGGSLRMTCARFGTLPEWSYRPGQDAPRGRRYPLAEIFTPAAARRGEAPACADSATTLTFAGLERGARRLARLLREQGVAPGRHVVVLSEKRAVMPLVAAAVWKADGVYVPVDAASPPARLAAILASTAPAAILGSARALAALSGLAAAGGVPATSFEAVLALTADDAAPEDAGAGVLSAERERPVADENRPAYVMFTSGSTGTPKGVVIPHRALLDYFFNHNQVLRFSPASRVFSLAPFHFDVSIEDTILPLSLGAFVRQYDGIPLGPPMRRTLRRERITHLIAVSSLLQLITGDGTEIYEAHLPDLGMVMTGAEVADPRLIDLWVERLPRARVINAYGPTEATIVCMTHTIGLPEPGRQGTYPIGAPLPRVLARLVGEDGAPLSGAGATGELLIGGSQVMTGYLGMEEATRASLVVIDGERYYRTRDICRLDAEGRYVFVERADDMVKVGGRRIHLGEIRHHAMALPGVERVAVGLVPTPDGHAALGLVAVVAGPDAPDEAQIRAGLATQLTAATMPALVAVTPVVRLTVTGKTDEKGLLAAFLGASLPAEPPPSPTALERVPA